MNNTPATTFAAADDRLQRTAERVACFDLPTATLARLIHFTAKSLADAANTALKTQGLNYPGYAILITLLGAADFALTPSELAAATHEKPANITRLCDDLAQQGLLHRATDPLDRRRVRVALTPEGQTRLTHLLPPVITVTQAQFARLTPEEQHTLTHLLRQLIDGPMPT